MMDEESLEGTDVILNVVIMLLAWCTLLSLVCRWLMPEDLPRQLQLGPSIVTACS